MDFDAAFEHLMRTEGGYAFHPSDPGGETMLGVTARVARAEGYTGEMRHLPRETAKAIARCRYWDAVRADEMPPAMRYPLFDAAYHSGPAQAVKWLQRALGVGDDGKVGPITLAAAHRAGPLAGARMLAERLDFLTNLPTWPAFGRGWSRRIAAVLKEAMA